MIPWEKVLSLEKQQKRKNRSIVPGPGEKGFKIMKSTFGLFEKTVLSFLQYYFIICYICLSPTYSLPFNTQQVEYSPKSLNIPLLASPRTEEPINAINSSSSMIVRVIVSSSSSSSSGGSNNVNPNYNRPSRSNQPIHFPIYQESTTPQPYLPSPTTYHPPVSFFLSSLPSHPIPISQSIRRFGSPQPQSSSPHPHDIFSVFYHAFSQQHPRRRVDFLNAATINAPAVRIFTPPTAPKRAYFPISPTTTTTTEKVVAVISQSQSISSSSTSTSSFYYPRPEPLIGTTTGTPVPTITTTTTTERTNWEEAETVWGESERVWGVPEKVWGTPESSINYTTPTPFQDLDSEEEYESAKYYELGEDESDEPKELSLDPDSMRSKLENAQVISRHYELPELKMSMKHGSTIPLMTIESPGGGTESFQITDDPATGTTESTLVPVPAEPAFGDRLSTTERPPGKKFGYVLDGPGSDIRKYRVEERTSDGYIVGEYGVINQENGFLRGVRYTADGTINPRLIHETLMKFLSL